MLVLLAVGGVLLAAWCAGLRWFVVETPSMGTAAPVGTLVVVEPLRSTPPRVGEVVTFSPASGSSMIVTHRVVAVTSTGIRTRGDINATRDPWTTPADRVVGRAVLLVPAAGWALRVVPVLLAALVGVDLLARRIRTDARRAAVRVLGSGVAVSAILGVMRPLQGVAVMGASQADGHAAALVVSTGLLPVRVASGDAVLHLTSGQVGRLVVDSVQDGRYQLTTALDPGPIGWAVIVVICAAPTAWALLLGPRAADRTA